MPHAGQDAVATVVCARSVTRRVSWSIWSRIWRVDGKPIECREMLKNNTVSRDASSHIVILHGRGAMPRVGLNPAKRSIQGHPHKTSKNPSFDSKLNRCGGFRGW